MFKIPITTRNNNNLQANNLHTSDGQMKSQEPFSLFSEPTGWRPLQPRVESTLNCNLKSSTSSETKSYLSWRYDILPGGRMAPIMTVWYAAGQYQFITWLDTTWVSYTIALLLGGIHHSPCRPDQETLPTNGVTPVFSFLIFSLLSFVYGGCSRVMPCVNIYPVDHW